MSIDVGDKAAFGRDPTNKAMIEESHGLFKINEGDAYFINYSADAGVGASVEIRLAVPDTSKWPHLVIGVCSSGRADAYFYEGTTKTHVAENALAPVCRNRNILTASGMTICHTPGGSGDGTQIDKTPVETKLAGYKSLTGPQPDRLSKMILKQNTVYLLKVTSSVGSNTIDVNLNWSEHANVALND